MIWFVAVVGVSVIISLLRGGKLANIPDIYAKGWWMLFVGLGLQAAANSVNNARLAIVLLLTSYVGLLVIVYLNRSQAGIWTIGIGILMNFIVITFNGGMPVLNEAILLAGGTPDIAFDAKHVILDSMTKFPFLADIVPLPGSVISLGDVFLAVGLGVFIEDQLRRPPRLFRHRVQGVAGSAADS